MGEGLPCHQGGPAGDSATLESESDCQTVLLNDKYCMEAPGASKNGDAVGGRTNYGQMQQRSLEHVVNMVSNYTN